MPENVVCFDLGGVLIRIHHTWGDAGDAIGVKKLQKVGALTEFPAFNAYQTDDLDETAYGDALGSYLGVSSEDALRTHDAILAGDYPGAVALIDAIRAAGHGTACLSNTNPRHWEVLTDPVRHPVVAELDFRYASHLLGAAKPDPGAFRRVADRHPGARFVFFDDSPMNVQAAEEAGWRAFLVDPNDDPPARMRASLVSEGLLG